MCSLRLLGPSAIAARIAQKLLLQRQQLVYLAQELPRDPLLPTVDGAV